MMTRSLVLPVSVLTLSLALTACGSSQDEPLTYEEFRSLTYQEEDTGVFILNGDELAETEVELRQAHARYLDAFAITAAAAGQANQSRQPLIVNRVRSADDRWSTAQAGNLTYCISQSSFGNNYNAMVTAMNAATAEWEASARVNFVHSSNLDSNCTNRSNVVFNIRRVNTTQYLARAFFPSTSRRSRELLVASDSFGNIAPWTLQGILRHELGHTLGFRHEHTRPEAGTCFEDNAWRALTTYDAASVMHYPQCNGSQTGDLVLTNLDRQGATALYP